MYICEGNLYFTECMDNGNASVNRTVTVKCVLDQDHIQYGGVHTTAAAITDETQDCRQLGSVRVLLTKTCCIVKPKMTVTG